jgi:hypothetical protein
LPYDLCVRAVDVSNARLLNERQRMAVKGMQGSFEFVSLLGAFQRAKSENEKDRWISRQFGLMCWL